MTTKTCTLEVEVDYAEIIDCLDYHDLARELDYSELEIDYSQLETEINYEEIADNFVYRLERASGEDLLNKIVEKVSAKVAEILTEKEKKSEEKVTQVREQLATLLEALKP